MAKKTKEKTKIKKQKGKKTNEKKIN